MRLPLKFLPHRSTQLAEVVAALFVTGFSLSLVVNYLPAQSPAPGQGFIDWLGGGGRAMLLFLAIALAIFLAGLGWVAVTVLNLAGGSPFKSLTVDRFGISHRTFWRDRRYSWKDLEEIRPHKISLWRSRSNEQRFWIVEGEYGKPGGLRINAGDFLGGGWLFGNIALATDETAHWLESLRQLARMDRLEPDDVPRPPEALRAPVEIDHGRDGAAVPKDDDQSSTQLPPSHERNFGNRTVER